MSSVVPLSQKVKVPGKDGEMAPFRSLSVTGGVVNAHTAVAKAQNVKPKKGKRRKWSAAGKSQQTIKATKPRA